MNSLCTILIPTHNRVGYLNRCVQWFLELGYPIVIADSSREPWQSELKENQAVRYVHCPGGSGLCNQAAASASGSAHSFGCHVR